MTVVLPSCFSNRAECVWDRPAALASGGVSVFGGAPQDRRMDGGGAWRARLDGIVLLDAARQRTWQALMTRWTMGDLVIDVPYPWTRLRADFAGDLVSTEWSDGVPFDDGSLFAGGDGFAVLDAAIALRDYSATLVLPPGAALQGGEPFTLVGTTYGPRLHFVSAVTEVVADPDGDTVTIEFGPNAREAYLAGADVDFRTPRCRMRAQPDSDGASPAYGRSRFAKASMTFWEDL